MIRTAELEFFPLLSPIRPRLKFFWGYRNHIINDCSSELPIAEITLAANVRGTHIVIPQLEALKDALFLKPVAVIADS